MPLPQAVQNRQSRLLGSSKGGESTRKYCYKSNNSFMSVRIDLEPNRPRSIIDRHTAPPNIAKVIGGRRRTKSILAMNVLDDQ
jgi:hypothetical protein